MENLLDTRIINNNDNLDILAKIININEQIKIRDSIPINLRTEKQSIKLDNLLYELKQLTEQLY